MDSIRLCDRKYSLIFSKTVLHYVDVNVNESFNFDKSRKVILHDKQGSFRLEELG